MTLITLDMSEVPAALTDAITGMANETDYQLVDELASEKDLETVRALGTKQIYS